MTLVPMFRGDDETIFPHVERPAVGSVPALDFTTILSATFTGRADGVGVLFTKGLGTGVTVDGPNDVTLDIDPADTAGLPGDSRVVLELSVVEADGRVTTPWQESIMVREDLA